MGENSWERRDSSKLLKVAGPSGGQNMGNTNPSKSVNITLHSLYYVLETFHGSFEVAES